MIRYTLVSLFIVFFHFSVLAQWQYGMDVQFSKARLFSWEAGYLSGLNSNTGIIYWFEYRFKEKERGPFKYQDGFRTDIQLYLRNVPDAVTGSINSQWLRFPFWWTRTLPRILKDEKHPIFELNTGVGYYLAKPISVSNRFTTIQKQNYSTHGFLGEIGLAFYLQTGSRINVNFNYSMDLGALNVAPTDEVLKFIDRGMTVGFSSSFSDTRLRMQAMRKAQRERREKRKKRRKRK